MFYKSINSSVVINFNTSNIFDILCGVRQGCPISIFLFLLAIITKYCSKSRIRSNLCFGRENNISQSADDTTLFLMDESQVSKSLK